ncbi:SpoIIE family protein phosphatase [Rhodococcus sp. CSLK01-03]|uniref:SpoIIE family protein phosphatase n=1 Tax=Rhodococcus indonesiensis TaxID=3055869 RepID=A0ABT7RPC7_9NOCA|nr:SpoIIE family protein phosphatase [Rhodococcus indonesiensis]MDM7489500.1 SpoIIE family protein phosphatase [Rhodococcus indonesiensis]
MTTDTSQLPDDLEDERVRDLERLEVLDTPREDRFEQITRMARHVFGVPMASVALLDRDRLWFKSLQGLDLVQVPREESICKTTIVRTYHHPDDPTLIVEDASADPLFAGLPGVGGDDGVRFYAGYPLYGPAGHPVGTFCIYDTEPRTLDPDQLVAFAELADWAQRELQRADELDRAAAMQAQLLPRPLTGLPGYEVRAVCIPAFVVGGDFYDHYPLRGGLVVTVADVMGKGLGAAILSSAVRSTFRGASRVMERFSHAATCSVLDTGAALTAAAENLADDCEHTGTFVTVFHAAVEFATGSVDYVDAGHGLAAIRRVDGSVAPLAGTGLPVGVLRESTWQAQCTHLEPGDTLVICSDGLLDLLDEHSDRQALYRFVAGHATPHDLIEAARALAGGRPPMDDVTVVAVRRCEDA